MRLRAPLLLFATSLWMLPVCLLAGEESNTDTKPVYGGTLVIGITRDVDSFNPLFNESAIAQEVTHLVLLGLADLDDKSEFVGELAESWHHSEDFLKLTYHLRPDVVWSDGTPVTAHDVVFTYALLMDSTVASPRAVTTTYLKRVTASDARTVTFEFTRAYPDQMFDTAGEIIPKHIFEGVAHDALRSHAFGRKPLATGPFRVNKWVHQQFIELVRNERYFGQRPYLDRVIFKIVPDPGNLLLQLQAGEVDMMIGVPASEVAQLRRDHPELEIHSVAGRVYYYMGYNLKHPMFADRRVRQALTMAIDRQGIIDALLYGFGSPCRGPLSGKMTPGLQQEDIDFPYDPERARALLQEAGWHDNDGDGWLDRQGRAFEFTVKTNAGNVLRSDVAVIVQNQLKRIGVRVNIATIEWSTLMAELRAGNFEAYMGGWSTSINPDLSPIFHSSSQDQFNLIGYANPEVDRLIEQAREEMDAKQAVRLWSRVHNLIYRDQPYTFLFWKDKVVAVNRAFKNVTPIPLSALYGLETWYRARN